MEPEIGFKYKFQVNEFTITGKFKGRFELLWDNGSTNTMSSSIGAKTLNSDCNLITKKIRNTKLAKKMYTDIVKETEEYLWVN